MATQNPKSINHPRECCICFDDIAGHVVETKCYHVYHFKCLNTSLNADDGASNNASTNGILENMTEEEQVAHVIDLTRDAIHPNNKVCLVCKRVVNPEENIHFVDYENKFANMDTDGLSDTQKKAVQKRKRAKQKQAERRKRNKPNSGNVQ